MELFVSSAKSAHFIKASDPSRRLQTVSQKKKSREGKGFCLLVHLTHTDGCEKGQT
jgi:hypothetical protein